MMSTPRIFAHRGSHSISSESSLASYCAAVEDGADGFECDIRMTSDNHLVVWHDPTMQRIAGNPRRISHSTLAQLRSAWPIMTLNELIDLAVLHKKDLAIETKHPSRYGRRVERALASILASRSDEISKSKIDISIMSFSWWATRFASKLPYNDVLLVNRAKQLSYVTHSTAGLNIDIIRKSPEIVSTLHSRGKKVFVWTVNNEADISLCKQNKVDVIITDNVSLAKTL